MKYLLFITCLSILLSGELEVDGNIKLEGSIIFNDQSSIDTAPTLPSGVIIQFAGTTAPNGWLLCAGQELSRSEFPALFATIGELYGSGNGETTFNIPDFRGRIALGMDNMNGLSANRVLNEAADSLGGADGSERHTLSVNEMPSHSHNILLPTGSGSSSGWKVGTRGPNNSSPNNESFSDFIEPEGGSEPHNNMPPYLTINYIIKY